MNSFHREDTSQVEMSRAERLLALAMIFFLLLGGAWTFRQIQNVPIRPDYSSIHNRHISADLLGRYHVAEGVLNEARAQSYRRQEEMTRALQEYEFRREEHRVMLEKGITDPAREQAYLAALQTYESARESLDVAREVEKRSLEGSESIRTEYKNAERKVSEDYNAAYRRFEGILFLLRLVYTIPVFLGALWYFGRLRRSGSPFLILATALIGFSALQLLFLFGLYTWHFLRDIAQILIAITGTALSVLGIVWLRKHFLDSARLSKNRVRKGMCPACGTSVQGNTYCLSCGEKLKEECHSCKEARPVAAAFCPHCGSK